MLKSLSPYLDELIGIYRSQFPAEQSQPFVRMSPDIRSNEFPSGCRSTNMPPLLDHDEEETGRVRSSPWSSVMPTMRAGIGGSTVVMVTG